MSFTMNLLYITPHPPDQTGIAYYAEEFIKALGEHTNTNVTLFSNKSMDHPNSIQAIRENIRYLEKEISLKDYDIVHFELSGSNLREFHLLYRIIKSDSRIPKIATVHDPPLLVRHPLLFKEFKDFFGLNYLCGTLTFLPGMMMEKKAYTSLDRLFTFTEKGRKKLLDRFGEKGICVLPMGINIPKEKHPSEKEKTTILFYGYLYPTKGIDVLLTAYSILLKENPDLKENTRLLVCGDITGYSAMPRVMAYKKRLLALVDTLRIKDYMEFTGFVSDEKEGEVFSSSEILVLPYMDAGLSSTSLTLLKGMSHGLAIIASNVRALSEDVVDGETGVLVKPGDPHELAEKLKRLVLDEKERNRLGRNARQHIIEEHDWRRVVKRVMEQYDKLLAGG